jgi:hypothetical protein
LVVPIIGGILTSFALQGAFGGFGSSGALLGGIKMGVGYTSGAYLGYGVWNNLLDPFGVSSTGKFTQRGSTNISLGLTKYKKMPFYRRRMYGGYRRRYRRYSRFRRYRRYY